MTGEIAFERLLRQLMALEGESEWLEFKQNNADPEAIGEYLSALANGAALRGERAAFLVWGVEDATRTLVGTSVDPGMKVQGSQGLEHWLVSQLQPRLDVVWHRGVVEGHRIVIAEIPAARYMPVRFKNVEWIRVNEHKRRLSDFPEKERALWALFRERPFELESALADLSAQEVFELLDSEAYFFMMKLRLPIEAEARMERLIRESFVMNRRDGNYDVTNLGALLFGRDLSMARALERKALRIVSYEEDTRAGALREKVIQTGYALGFERALEAIHDLLVTRQVVEGPLREERAAYPDVALRELVANSLIHQDFNMSGAGPLVEIFHSRIEISNPGQPLLDPLRFLDMPPRSRNEQLASTMRRLRICEELGTGIDKVIRATERAKLPPPDFQHVGDNTRVIIYAWRPVQELSKQDKLRACYQHASLRWVDGGEPLTNASLRERLSLEAASYQVVSKIIADALEAQLIKPLDPANRSRRTASYIPFWA